MWEEDVSGDEDSSGSFGSSGGFENYDGPFEDRAPGADDVPPPSGQFAPFPQPVSLPHLVPIMNLYDAARARAVADQQLSKLFNPEYYI